MQLVLIQLSVLTTEPVEQIVGQGIDATFNVVASVSDDSELSYQWIRGNEVLI